MTIREAEQCLAEARNDLEAAIRIYAHKRTRSGERKIRNAREGVQKYQHWVKVLRKGR